ncbi:MAG: permease, partial [Myxococcota bacterium]
EDRTLAEKLREMIRFGFAEVVDDTAPWIVAGLVLAAVLSSGGIPDWTHQLPLGLDVVFFAILGMPFYVCASGATPLAAALVFAGVSPGAGIAFLISGPATNVTTFGVLSQLHGKRAAATFAVAVIAFSIGVGYAINLVWDASGLAGQASGLDPHGSWIQWASLAGIGLIFLASLVRVGPTVWLNTVLSFGMSSEDDCCEDSCGGDGHDHDHDHGHAAPSPDDSSCCSSDSCH